MLKSHLPLYFHHSQLLYLFDYLPILHPHYSLHNLHSLFLFLVEFLLLWYLYHYTLVHQNNSFHVSYIHLVMILHLSFHQYQSLSYPLLHWLLQMWRLLLLLIGMFLLHLLLYYHNLLMLCLSFPYFHLFHLLLYFLLYHILHLHLMNLYHRSIFLVVIHKQHYWTWFSVSITLKK